MKTLAAIDVGTNTIKLLVAAVEEDGTLEELVREKEMVRLGSETLFTGRLSEEAVEAGISAVESLVQTARAAGAEEIRAVATCAVREAANGDELATGVLRRTGVPLEVISGEEEARLIHLAARSEFPRELDPLLVVDIGGGSSELVISRRGRVVVSESIPIGVVRLSRRRHDPPDEADLRAMKKAIRASARRSVERVRRAGFRACVGSSGTIQSLAMVHDAAILGREANIRGHRSLTRKGLKRVNRLLRTTTMREKLRVPGLDPRRRDISVAGGLLLAWILKRVGAEAIAVGERGLREGLLLDHFGRAGRSRFAVAGMDVRARSVDRLLQRSGAEIEHASAVTRLALAIFDQTHGLHQLARAERDWLQYAGLLHDVGRAVGHSRHERHSHYVISHGDLKGFATEEIEVLALVARYHRGRGPKSSHEHWRSIDPALKSVVRKLAAILRIADGLDRSHRQLVTRVTCRVRGRQVEIVAAAREDCEPELTAARKKANLFEKVFDRRVDLRAVAAQRADRHDQPSLEVVPAEALWSS